MATRIVVVPAQGCPHVGGSTYSGLPKTYLCDTDAEKPTSGFVKGDSCVTADGGGKVYEAFADNVWTQTNGGGGAPDATPTVKGILQLAGDLSGTAASPTVPGLAGKANTSHTHAESDITGLVSDLTALDAATDAVASDLASHIAAGDPHTTYQKESEKSAANGYASLDAGTKIPIAEIPTGTSASTACVGNDARLSYARTPTAHAASHKSGGSDAIKLDELAAPTDVTTLNASASTHGLCPKLSNVATEFLNGTGAFSTPAGGGGGPSKVRKTADQTKTDGTLVNATDLSFAVSANTTYRFKFGLIFRSTVATVGLKCTVTFPAVTVFAATARIPIAADGAGMEWQGAISSSGDAVTGSAVPAINVDYFAVVEGVIRPSANGTLQLQFAAETTGATVTLKANSIGELDTY